MLSKIAVFVIAATFACQVSAFWRMNCANIQYGRIDPIVNPGLVSAHVHTIQGSNNFGVNATYASLSTSDCTSCEIQDDKSAYWTPLMYYQYANGSLSNVLQQGSVVYYMGRGTNRFNAQPFPPGFRMVSGNAAARSYNTVDLTYENVRPIADRVSWACLSTTPMRETPGINITDCYAGLRAQLHFQSCWDGVNLYKSDNSHVAYMSEIDNGDCPPAYPVQLVHIFLEVSYTVNTVARETGGRFVLSTGDPTGYSFHGDFQNGWNMTTQTAAVAQCANNDPSSGDINECPPLLNSYIRNAPQRCPFQNSTVNETVTGLLPKLPGCINIVNGPAPAQPSDMTCPSSITPPKILATPDSTPLPIKVATPGQPFGLSGWNYAGCSNDTQNGGRILNARILSLANMTVEYCQSYCTAQGFKYAGLELSTQCYCDNYLLNNPVFSNGTLTQGMCYWQCGGNPNEYCGGQARIDIYNNTAIAPIPQPSIQRASGTYGYKGCYTELNQGRALANGSLAGSTMTPDVCRKFCLGKAFRFFGVEYGRECYCGDRVDPTSSQVADTQCSQVCAGNSGTVQAFCGAASRFALYYSATL